MDSFELNKILGALLGTCLVLLRQRDAAKTELLRARELRADHDGLNRLLEGLR